MISSHSQMPLLGASIPLFASPAAVPGQDCIQHIHYDGVVGRELLTQALEQDNAQKRTFPDIIVNPGLTYEHIRKICPPVCAEIVLGYPKSAVNRIRHRVARCCHDFSQPFHPTGLSDDLGSAVIQIIAVRFESQAGQLSSMTLP